jgi:sugar phosphate isomerase/epimerase
MLYTGLVSITFRKLSPKKIVDLTAEAGLDGIEWGGDVHVPHGDVNKARSVAGMTADAGLAVASYGSYYRAGPEGDIDFAAVLDTASALGAPIIRVWAGRRASANADEAYRREVAADLGSATDMARERKIGIALEFHGNTLTDTDDSAVRLLQAVDRENLSSYWQPPHHMSATERLRTLRTMLPWLSHVHAFHWHPDTRERCLLTDGEGQWASYLKEIAGTGRDHSVMLEFVQDDSIEVFLQDAQTLRKLIAQAHDSP